MLITTVKLPHIKEKYSITYALFDKGAAKKILLQLYEYYNAPEECVPRFEIVWEPS